MFDKFFWGSMFLLKHNYIHKDIKTDNLLQDKEGHMKLSHLYFVNDLP